MFVNVDWAFASHRLPIAQDACRRGVSMTVFADRSHRRPNFDDEEFEFRQSPIRRKTGIYFMLVELVRSAITVHVGQPQVLHAVTVKPILLIGLVARFLNMPFIGSVSGLGPAFSNNGFLQYIRSSLVIFVYRFIFGNKNSMAIVQTEHDREVMLASSICKPSQLHVFRGSGVRVSDFNRDSPHIGAVSFGDASEKKRVRVLMASRILSDKGVVEYLDAVTLLAKELLDVEWLLAGPFDEDSPTCLEKGFVMEKCSDAGVTYLGNVENMPELLSSVDLFVYPSYYPEGLPKILLEASAAGVPVITADHPGCRDGIVNGSSGLLVKPRDVDDLVRAVRLLAKDETTREEMARFGSAYAEENYDVARIVDRHFALYQLFFD
jgi:glycosyltransferase involved in cell wall biosynthesis